VLPSLPTIRLRWPSLSNRVGEVLFRGAALDPELSLLGKLERGRTTTQRIEHRRKFLRRILRS